MGATFWLRDPSKSNSGGFISIYFRLDIDWYRTQLLVAVYQKLHPLVFQIPRYRKKTNATLPLDSPNRLQRTHMGGCSNPKASRLALVALVMSRGRQKRIQTSPQ